MIIRNGKTIPATVVAEKLKYFHIVYSNCFSYSIIIVTSQGIEWGERDKKKGAKTSVQIKF